MQRMCHQRENHAVSLSNWNRDLQRTMMGSGGGYPVGTNIEREIAKMLINATNESEFAADWPAFLDARKGTARELVMRRFVEAVDSGGLTEIEARDAIVDRTCLRLGDCVSHALVEDSDLPVDRYFRDAWEWSD